MPATYRRETCAYCGGPPSRIDPNRCASCGANGWARPFQGWRPSDDDPEPRPPGTAVLLPDRGVDARRLQ